MYIPKSNEFTNNDKIVEFIKKFSFGTLITSNDDISTATHIPFLISTKDDKIILTSHLAKANN